MKKLEHMWEIVEPRIKKIYWTNGDKFKAGSMDYEDVKQEILITIWEVLEKLDANMDETGKRKMVNASISNKINNMLRKIYRHDMIDGHVPVTINIDEVSDFMDLETTENSINFEELKSHPSFIDESKRLLSKLEYDVIHYKYEGGYNIQEIAEKTGFSYEWVRQVLNKALNKLKKIKK